MEVCLLASCLMYKCVFCSTLIVLALLLRSENVSDVAAKGSKMCLAHIALGGTYQVQTPLAPGFTVRVEAIDVHHIGEYHCLAQVLRFAFVWVYEPQRGLRYPVSPQALHPVQG